MLVDGVNIPMQAILFELHHVSLIVGTFLNLLTCNVDAPSYSVTSDVERIFSTQGMPGIVAMLQRSPSVAIVQRLGIQRLAKLLITCESMHQKTL